MALLLRVAAVLLAACSPALAQSVLEVEPNSTKSEAMSVTMTPTTTVFGTCSGTITTPGDTTVASVDVFRLKNSPLPPGIYSHRLTITAQHATSLRGVNQTGTVGVGGVAGTVDVAVQESTDTSAQNRWYGFGKQEEIYYRVAGINGGLSTYNFYLWTTTVTPPAIATPFESTQPITITTVSQATGNTELLLYDANFSPVPGGLNDDEFQGATTQSKLTRILPAGTYYLALASGLSSSETAVSDDDNVSGPLTDFPDCVVGWNSFASTTWSFRISGSNGTFSQVVSDSSDGPNTVSWWRFTTVPGAPIIPGPTNDHCAAALPITFGAECLLGAATNDGMASCDPGGIASRDLWYSFTNPLAVTSACHVDTCSYSPNAETVVTAFAGCGLAELACNDNCAGSPCGGPGGCTGLVLAPGQTILIRVSDKGLGAWNCTLRVRNDPTPPQNDSCATPLAIAGVGPHAPFDNIGATTGAEGQNEILCVSAGTPVIERDLWFTWTSPYTGTWAVQTCSTISGSPSQDSKIAIYAGSGCPTGPAIACNDDTLTTCAYSPLNARVEFQAVISNVYTIQIGSGASSNGAIEGALGMTGNNITASSTMTTAVCLGDGIGSYCACSNWGAIGNGCAGSVFSTGARLCATGTAGASAATDSWVLTAESIPGPGLFFQGTGTTTNQVPFGDSRLCISTGILRLGVASPTGTAAQLPNPTAPTPIHVLGGTAQGQTRYYQCWYRSFPGVCGNGPFNLTQGVRVVWTP